MERIKESPEKRLNNNNEKQFNEISDEAQHEISMAIHASARQSIRPYNSQVILPGQIRSNYKTEVGHRLRMLISRGNGPLECD